MLAVWSEQNTRITYTIKRKKNHNQNTKKFSAIQRKKDEGSPIAADYTCTI